MDETESKGLRVRGGPPEESAPIVKARQVGVDTRSREAFELLKLGEAICSLQADQRQMRLNAEDMRFERDRYKASALAFQNKLDTALAENARLRDLREILRTFSSQSEAQVKDEIADLHTALKKASIEFDELHREYERLLAEAHGTKSYAEQSSAESEAEKIRLIDALHHKTEEVSQLRRENQNVSEQLQDSIAQSQHMKQAYIILMQGIISDSQPIDDL